MDQTLFLSYLKEYALNALEAGEDDVSAAADYLESLKKPSFISKNRKEKRAALRRARKVFNASRDRTPYLVLKSLGFDELAKLKL